jgi:hypothetical protein
MILIIIIIIITAPGLYIAGMLGTFPCKPKIFRNLVKKAIMKGVK